MLALLTLDTPAHPRPAEQPLYERQYSTQFLNACPKSSVSDACAANLFSLTAALALNTMRQAFGFSLSSFTVAAARAVVTSLLLRTLIVSLSLSDALLRHFPRTRCTLCLLPRKQIKLLLVLCLMHSFPLCSKYEMGHAELTSRSCRNGTPFIALSVSLSRSGSE
jgi:hypothetical protein